MCAACCGDCSDWFWLAGWPLWCRFFGGNPFMGGRVYTANFGGQAYRQAHARRHQQAAGRGQAPTEANPLMQLMQLLPLLLLLMFTFFSSRSQPVYSLQPTREYRQQYATATYEVPFYVKDAQQLRSKYPPGSRER